ncbi:MAG TPA: bifunctional riboflavin kinase/FAD synthetase [Methylophilaceae bacterium]|jgi:riboflavin kinase/FMN adenylyltransferase
MQVFRHFPEKSEAPCVLAIGNFDGLHIGHQAILRRLKEEADANRILSCVMTFEPHAREFFDPKNAPARLTSLREKLEMFEAAGIDKVHVCHFDAAFAAMSAQSFMHDILHRSLAVKQVMVGKDFCFGAKRSGNLHTLQTGGEELGFTVAAVPNVMFGDMRVSSTEVRSALAAGDLQRAQALLGRPYTISGHIVHGDQLGRELGYPTANVQMHHDNPPLMGIYAVKLTGVDNMPLPGVASLGVRPTVKNNGKPTLEVHLFDFDRDIYGQHVQVQFLKKIREELKFPDLDALKSAMAADEKVAREFFMTDE